MRIRHVIGDRPFVPEDWIICNAPRPIYGTKLWQGPFISGVFYAGISPDDEQRDWLITRNTSLDAVQVFYHSEEAAISLAITYFKDEYQETFDEVDPDNEFLANAGLDILNGEK